MPLPRLTVTRPVALLSLTLCAIVAGAAETAPAPAKPKADTKDLTAGQVVPVMPAGYTATLFAKPPQVSYPVGLCATGSGDLYVAIDKNGSLSKDAHAGSIVRLRDTTGSGVADKIETFVADVDIPRGIYHDGAGVFCLHPPLLTYYQDTDGDGKADKVTDLVKGIGYGLDIHPGDHTSNGIRIGIDGWIYMAIGDFGVPTATGTDGSNVTFRGGGVFRVRPDGSEVELFAAHTRNIYDVSLDPYLNGFVYDNTNDGGGWNSRFTAFTSLADLGYPSLYKRFGNQLLPTQADFGGGSAVGSLYIHEPGLPGTDGDGEFICDWGTSKIYRIPLKANGAGWDPVQRTDWAKVDRVTDMDIDGNSQIYVSSWRKGSYRHSTDDVGAIVKLSSTAKDPAKFPDLKKASPQDLVGYLASASNVCRQQTQHEILRRGPQPAFAPGLESLAKDGKRPLYARIAALFTLKQLYGEKSHPALLALTQDPTIQEWALRALADRKTQLKGLTAEPFLAGLKSANPRVQLQAAIGLARLGDSTAAKALVPLTAVADDAKDAQLALPHVAVRALVALKNAAPVIAAVTPEASPEQLNGALWTLKWMHDVDSVKALVALLPKAKPEFARKLYDTLAHLYYTEDTWNKLDWWTTRPDHTGPYFKKVAWAGTPIIEPVLKTAALASTEMGGYVAERVDFYNITIDGLPKRKKGDDGKKPSQADAALLAKALEAAKASTNGKDIGNLKYEDVLTVAIATKGDKAKGEELFSRQGCIACHAVSSNVPQKGPNLESSAAQYSRAELIESILKPNAIISQGFATRSFDLKNGDHVEGFVTNDSAETITVRNIAGMVTEIDTDKIVKRGESKQSMMPEGLMNNCTPEDLASLLAYMEALSKK